MSRPGTAPWLVRLVGWALMTLHPTRFSRELGEAYREGVEHRWRLERARSPGGAVRRTLWTLAADAARSLPAEWVGVVQRRRPRNRIHGRGGGTTMTGWIEGWLWDLRIALRGLARRPAVSGLVVGTLALGIGANATIFGALDRVILSPLTFENGDRAVYLMSRDPARGFTFSATQDQFERWRQGAVSFDGIEAFRQTGGFLVRGEVAEQVAGISVSDGLAALVRAVPLRGRIFGPADFEPGAPPVLMLAENYWRGDLGADPTVVGSTLELSDTEYTVVGVWPRRARVSIDGEPTFYRPLERGAELDRSAFSITLGVLAEGVESDEAAAELAALLSGLEETPGTRPTSDEVPVVLPPHAFVSADFKSALWIVFAGVGLLLVAAGVNAANVLLNRAVDRELELGVRLALGGGSGRLVRQFLLEGGLLAAIGAALGVACAHAGTDALARLAPPDVPASVLALDGARAGAYAAGLAVLLTAICGLVPALHLRSPAVRALVGSGLRIEASGRQRLRGFLVAGQVAFSAMLVFASGLALESLQRYDAIDFGFAVEELGVVTVRRGGEAPGDEGSRSARAALVRDQLESLPGVRAVSVSGDMPFHYTVRFGRPRLSEEPPPEGDDGSFSHSSGIAGGFLEALGLPLLEGRDFTAAERADAQAHRVVIVNRGFASRYPGSVLGRSLLFPSDTLGRRIVGVVGDVRAGDLTDESERAQVYYPSDGIMSRSQRYLIRAHGDPAALAASVRARVREADPGLHVTSFETGREMVAERTAGTRFLAVILGLFGGLSLALAIAGVYGAVTLGVARRTREMGIRMALGAGPARLATRVTAEGLRPVAVGLAGGLVAAAIGASWLVDALYGVSGRDPMAFLAAIVILGGSASLAAHLPARRATRVNPTIALRSE